MTLTGTNFAIGATTVNVTGAGLTVNAVVVGSTTLLTATSCRCGGSHWRSYGYGHNGRRDERGTKLHDQPAASDADERLTQSRHPRRDGTSNADGHQLHRRRDDGCRQPAAV